MNNTDTPPRPARRKVLKTVGMAGFVATLGSGTAVAQNENKNQSDYPEARFTVKKDGSGDYQSLDDAIRVAQDDDVIGVGVGDYNANLNKPLTFVGESPEETNIIVTEFTAGSTTSKFFNTTISTLDGPIHSSNKPTLQFKDAVIDAGVGKVDPPEPSENMSANLKFNNSTINGVIWTPSFCLLDATGSKFDNRLELDEVSIENCTVNDRINIEAEGENNIINDSTCNGMVTTGNNYGSTELTLDCINTSFSGGLQIRANTRIENCSVKGLQIGETPSGTGYSGNLTAVDTEILGTNSLNSAIKIVDYEAGRCYIDIEGCTISTQSTDAEYAIKSENNGINALIIDNCQVDNQIDCPTYQNDARYENTIFETNNANFDYFIDGKPSYVVNNAFIGADIRINSSGTSMYDEEIKKGNYYSAYNNEDEDNDGIIDLPRPIPGEGNVTDQYPLASPLEDGDGSQIEDPTERVLQITDKNSPSELTQNDVTATITRFERGQTVNGIDVEQDDVTNIITLFGRN